MKKRFFMDTRNEIKSYIVREGMTMSEVVDALQLTTDGAAAFRICLASCAGILCDTGKQ